MSTSGPSSTPGHEVTADIVSEAFASGGGGLGEAAVGDDPGRPDSEYADQMPLLREFAALPLGDERRSALREQLILAFLPVVAHLARRYSNGNSAMWDELTQVGSVGLITAIDRWDPERARGEFLGYLVPCVRGEILRWYRDRTWATRVPRRLKDLSVTIGRLTGPLSHELGRAPRPSELAARLQVSVEEVIEALDARASRTAAPIDVLDSETDTPLIDQLGQVDREMLTVEDRNVLWPLLEELPQRERTIVVLRFFGELTQTQIAQRVGVSQMHISRLLTRSLGHLRGRLVQD